MLTPPTGDSTQAEKYIDQLVNLIDMDKLDVFHTDLSKFDPGNLQDHYRLDLQEYKIEVSHSKYPNTGKDSYVLLFTNIKEVANGNSENVILAYLHLGEDQFMRFKRAFLEQFSRKKKMEEEEKLKQALQPIDQILDHMASAAKEGTDGIAITTPAVS